jgi:hypothetical protein
VREKQTTPGGISRIIYLKWQRRFREPKTRGPRPTSRYPGVRLFYPFFFLLPLFLNCQSLASPPPLNHSHSPYALLMCNLHIRPPCPCHHSRIKLGLTTPPRMPLTHVSSPSSPHDSSSVSPSMSSISRIASLRSKTQATLRPILPFNASETSPLTQAASTYDRLIGMRTVAIYKPVFVSANRKDNYRFWYISAPGQLSIPPRRVQSAVLVKARLRDQTAVVRGSADPKSQLLQLW